MKNEEDPTQFCLHDHNLYEDPLTENARSQPRISADITKDYTKVNFSSNASLRRRKRDTFPDGAPAFVETAVFVDRDLFDHMKTNYPIDTERELIRFVLAMINAVSMPI